MDFGLVGFDHLASRNPPQETQKWGGSEFLKQEMGINEEEEEEDPFRGFKVAKTCNYGSHWTGMESGRGPFSPSQWMELEHQALIYKYISSNVPIPCHLLNPIRKAFQSAACYPGLFPAGLRSNSLGWGGLHLGYNSGDPEPGRCRRTDGKKWRCSREAVAEGKYCERHMNRGRHRSRKPVEGQTGPSSTNTTNAGKAIHPQFNTLQSDNGHGHGRGQDSKSQNSLRQFVDYWPDAALQPDRATQLSISIPMATPESTKGKLSSSQELEMGLGVGNFSNEQRQATNWVPISWESPVGGPLGEVLHIAGDAKNAKPLNLMDSGKKLEGGNRCKGFKGPGAVMNPSLPAL